MAHLEVDGAIACRAVVQFCKEISQGRQLSQQPVVPAAIERPVDEGAQRLALQVLEHEHIVDEGVEPVGLDHVVRPAVEPDAAKEGEIVELGLALPAGVGGVRRSEKLAHQSGTRVNLLVKVDVTRIGELKDPVLGVGGG